MIKRLSWIAGKTLYSTWPFHTLLQKMRPRACILVYHRIAETSFDPFGQAVSPTHFEQHLKVIKHHYHIVPLDQLVAQLADRSYKDRTVAISFDDGYEDNLRVAYPILEKYQIPATVFVTLQPVLDQTSFWWDELALRVFHAPERAARLLAEKRGPSDVYVPSNDWRVLCDTLHAFLKRSTDCERREFLDTLTFHGSAPLPSLVIGRPLTTHELKEFALQSNIQIGAHTMTHPALAVRPSSEQLFELRESKSLLEGFIGYRITLVAYPFGKSRDVSNETFHLAQQAGYHAGFTTMARTVVPAQSPYALPRLIVHDWAAASFLSRLQTLFGES